MAQLLLWDELPIRVDDRGAWLHGDEPLHPRVQGLFLRHVVMTEAGGYGVQLHPKQKVAEIQVADCVYWVKQCHFTPAARGVGPVTLVLNDGREEPLDPRQLMQAEDNRLYARVTCGNWWVPARFTTSQYYALLTHAEMVDDVPSLLVGKERVHLSRFSAKPVATNTSRHR